MRILKNIWENFRFARMRVGNQANRFTMLPTIATESNTNNWIRKSNLVEWKTYGRYTTSQFSLEGLTKLPSSTVDRLASSQPDVQNETQLWWGSIYEPFVVHIIRINQSACSLFLSNNTHSWIICGLIVTYFVTHMWCTCDPLVIQLTNLQSICGLTVRHVSHCGYM